MINFTKRNAVQAADRLCRFYSGQMQDGICASLWIPPPPEIAALPPLVEPAPDDDVIKERDPVSWTELPALLEQQRRQVRANRDNPDDSLPSMVPVFHFENAIETANSRHVIDEVVEIPGWRSVWFSDGTGWPRAFDIRHELRRRMREVPMAMCCSKEELLQGLAERSLPGNTSYGAWAGSLDEANRIMDLVREYRI
jgi:hypothetical protein